MEKKFRKGEVVWAKVRGFPWWPAVVKSVNIKILKQDEEEEEYRNTTALVYFIGDNSHSELPINKVEKFTHKYEEYAKTKKKSLQNSIKLANKILSNELSFEKHLADLNKNEKGKKFTQIEKSESIVNNN
jgi:F0F1-type ATP synthase alpha subunit